MRRTKLHLLLYHLQDYHNIRSQECLAEDWGRAKFVKSFRKIATICKLFSTEEQWQQPLLLPFMLNLKFHMWLFLCHHVHKFILACTNSTYKRCTYKQAASNYTYQEQEIVITTCTVSRFRVLTFWLRGPRHASALLRLVIQGETHLHLGAFSVSLRHRHEAWCSGKLEEAQQKKRETKRKVYE